MTVFGALAQTVQAVTPAPLASAADTFALQLAFGGVVGALIHAVLTRGVGGFRPSCALLETVQNAILGFLVGALYNVPIGGVWPLVPLAGHALPWQQALQVAVLVAAGVEVLKRVLVKFAPAYVERLVKQAGLEVPPEPTILPKPGPPPQSA